MFNLKIATRLGIANRYNHKFKWLLKFIKRLKLFIRNEPKIFVIGLNKTGTTSVFVALKELGIDMSNQHDAERIYQDILTERKSENDILNYCKYYEGFQDIPFSVPGFYKLLDKKFKKSKFILTVRESADKWYTSFNKYYDVDGKLHQDDYISEGFLFKVFSKIYNSDNFDRETCTNIYSKHHKDVLEYFEGRDQKLIVIDVSDEKAYQDLCSFLNKEPMRQKFAWKNKGSR